MRTDSATILPGSGEHYRRHLRRIPKRTWGDWHVAWDGSDGSADDLDLDDDTKQLIAILRAAGGIMSLREFAYQFTVSFRANPALALDGLAGVLAHGEAGVQILAPYGVCMCGLTASSKGQTVPELLRPAR